MPRKKSSLIIRGVKYKSAEDAAKHLKVSTRTVYRAKASGRLETLGLSSPGIREIIDNEKQRESVSRKILIQGVEYPSVKIAAEVFGVTTETIRRAERSGRLNKLKQKEKRARRSPKVSLPQPPQGLNI